MPEPIVKSSNEARAGSKEGVVRYVLVVSLVLVVILFIAAYLLWAPSASDHSAAPGPQAGNHVSLFISPPGVRLFSASGGGA